MGGVWERQIRSIRSVLSGLLQQSGGQLDDESLRTFMCETAAIINSRPLTLENLNDATCITPLSPNNLLTGKTNVVMPPPGAFMRPDLYCRRRWRRVQHLVEEFWKRWQKEFLQQLQQRHKWTTTKRDLKQGDVVLIKDDSLPRCQWKLGRVHDTCPSQDGHVRKATIIVGDPLLSKTGHRVRSVTKLDRPVHKLVLLLEAPGVYST